MATKYFSLYLKEANSVMKIKYIHTYSRFIPEGLAEASQIVLPDAHNDSLDKYCRCDRW
jgi:hypothetical protein